MLKAQLNSFVLPDYWSCLVTLNLPQGLDCPSSAVAGRRSRLHYRNSVRRRQMYPQAFDPPLNVGGREREAVARRVMRLWSEKMEVEKLE